MIDPVGALCGSCRRGIYAFDFARAWGAFKTPLKEVIHEFKYRTHFSLARPLAAHLASVYQAHPASLQADFIIPVPLHHIRQRERGFSQAFELSKYLGRAIDLEVKKGWLLRVRATKVQAGLSRRERRLNLNGAFKVPRKARLKGKSVLLIDDVFTTGATLAEAARALEQAGAPRIHGVTFARAAIPDFT